jgi:hypothetical protein
MLLTNINVDYIYCADFTVRSVSVSCGVVSFAIMIIFFGIFFVQCAVSLSNMQLFNNFWTTEFFLQGSLAYSGQMFSTHVSWRMSIAPLAMCDNSLVFVIVRVEGLCMSYSAFFPWNIFLNVVYLTKYLENRDCVVEMFAVWCHEHIKRDWPHCNMSACCLQLWLCSSQQFFDLEEHGSEQWSL